jgi:hypothetical protein
MVDQAAFAHSGVSPHRALCWLVREAVDRLQHDGGPARGRYKRAYREAEAALKARGLAFEPLDGARLDMLIAKPNAALLPAEVRTLGLIADQLTADLSEAELRALEAKAVERARTQPGLKPALPRSETDAGWAGLYAGALRERQALLGELEGDYLILRRRPTTEGGGRPALIVSHLTITAPADGTGPGSFRTLGAGTGKDERLVEGLIYEANAAHGVLFAVGRDAETAQVRNATLVATAKPVPGAALGHARRDLKGLRMGVSRFSGEPRAYRIWAASVTGRTPDGRDWRELVKDYVDGEPLAALEAGISGFGWILQWLQRPAACLDDDGDPPPA